MKIIQLDRYIPELSTLFSFYRYSEFAFSNQQLKQDITKDESIVMIQTILPFLKEDHDKSDDWQEILCYEIEKRVHNDIETGLVVLRRQILEAAYSIFEKYLCHVVRVYFYTFPQLLMEIEKNLPFRVIAKLKDNASIFDYAVDMEVEHFSRRSLQEKKDYLVKRLKQTRQAQVWTCDGEELWKDIDIKRQAIVHKEDIPEISHDYLLRAINCFQKIMMGIAIFAQVDQGVRFKWGVLSDYFKSQENPKLR